MNSFPFSSRWITHFHSFCFSFETFRGGFYSVDWTIETTCSLAFVSKHQWKHKVKKKLENGKLLHKSFFSAFFWKCFSSCRYKIIFLELSVLQSTKKTTKINWTLTQWKIFINAHEANFKSKVNAQCMCWLIFENY